MSSEQITQETVPVEQTTTETATPATQPTTETKPEVTTTTTTTTSSWKDSISEAYRNDPNIEKFTEIDALAKSYINATRMIGQDKMVVPNKNFTEDQWEEAYIKMGRPDSAEKYSLDFKSDVVSLDEQAIKNFQEQSFKLGLNNEQAKGVLDFYKNNMEAQNQQAKIDEVRLGSYKPSFETVQQENTIQSIIGKAGQTVDNALNELGKIPGAVVDFVNETVDVFGKTLNVGKTLASAAINTVVGGPVSLVFDAISNVEPSVSQIEYDSYTEDQQRID